MPAAMKLKVLTSVLVVLQFSFCKVVISNQVCLLFGQMWVCVLADEQRPVELLQPSERHFNLNEIKKIL